MKPGERRKRVSTGEAPHRLQQAADQVPTQHSIKSEFIILYKVGIALPNLREFDGIGVDGRNLMRFMFAQIPSDFSFPLPD